MKPQGFHIQLNLKDAVAAKRIFRALAENGSVDEFLLHFRRRFDWCFHVPHHEDDFPTQALLIKLKGRLTLPVER
jgi:hypothetical protein